MSLELQAPQVHQLFATMETTLESEVPRHKRKAILAVLNDRAMPPPTRTQLENFGTKLQQLEKVMRESIEQTIALRESAEEAPGQLLRARRERIAFALSVIKRVEPAYVMRSRGELEAEAMGGEPMAQNPHKPDEDIAALRALAGGIVDRFMGEEGENLVSDEPIEQRQREQIAIAIDLLTSIPNSSNGGDVYCDHVRRRACRTIIAFLDPERAKVDQAWAAAGAAS